MRDIWFLITDHKGIVKILAILIAIFCVVSIGVSSYTSTMKVQEQQEQQAKKKENEKQIKNSSVKLKKDQQKTIDEYDDATAQFSALLSSNVWATYSGTGRTLYFTDSSIIIADPEADPSKVEKPFVIKGLSTEKVDVGEMKNLTRYNCAYESDDDKTRVLTVDKNDDGTYFKMSIDVKNSGTNEEYVRTQAAGTFDIDGISEDICRILDRIADEIVGYNVAFDIGFLKAAGATINPDAAIIDTMQEFMDAFGNSNTGHRYQPLSMAAERLGYNWTSAPHDSLSDTLACLATQKCVDDHNWCVENLELTEDAIMHAKPIENGSEGLPKDCWDLNPGGRPFAVTEPILHRLQSSAKLCARAGTTTQFTRMTVNQWFDKAERSQRSPLGRSVDIGRAASALNSQHEHAEVPQDLTK